MHTDFSSEETTNWIISRARGGKNNLERKDNNKLIRTDIALDQEKCDVYISEYIEDSEDFPEFKSDKTAARKAAAKLKGIFETIRKFSIPFVALDNDAPLESVCRVFETINSTGTRLTTFDLAVAKFYPEPDLKSLMTDSEDRHPIFSEYDIDGERILQILLLHNLRQVNKLSTPEATRSAILDLKNKSFIQERWDAAAFHLSETCEWVKQLGVTAKTQPPHGTLVSIAAFLMCYPDSLNDPEFSATLRKWYFCTTLAANPSPATNYKIGDDFKRFCDMKEKGGLVLYPRVYFNAEDVIHIKHISDSRYKAIQALMRTTVKEDLLTGNALSGNLEDHHIFPYALNKSGISKNFLNSIANKIIVSHVTNRKSSDANPDSYLINLVKLHRSQGSTGDLDRRLNNCFLPFSSNDSELEMKLSKENFEQFLYDRALMIISRIKDVVGDAWQAPLGTEDMNLEDDEFVSI